MAGPGFRAAQKLWGGMAASERPRQGLAPHESRGRDSQGRLAVCVLRRPDGPADISRCVTGNEICEVLRGKYTHY